ncbi:ATP-binding protein [Actinotalea subterranea]|uniref:ATP-binding protein n=1 Tax=Actinotalea subterranea TaxID=2607497 RepID=UPI002482B261|nr:ATP-binding protein [Actinotalea subterranea]
MGRRGVRSVLIGRGRLGNHLAAGPCDPLPEDFDAVDLRAGRGWPWCRSVGRPDVDREAELHAHGEPRSRGHRKPPKSRLTGHRSTLAIGLGIKAAEATCPVAFNSATGWSTRLADAHNRGVLERELRRVGRYRLLVIDEVG